MLRRTFKLALAALMLLAVLPRPVLADQSARVGAGAILYAAQPTTASAERLHTASLFSGRKGTSLFAPIPASSASKAIETGRRTQFSTGLLTLGGSEAARIRHLIGHAEARREGYDAVQHAARILPPGRPTALTIAEIYQWIDQTPGQHHAIGRYQFIPATLKRLVRVLGIDERSTFSPGLQDRLANRLLEEAGLSRFRNGEITRHQFMNNLAKIWAGLPTTSGKSHYHGYAGNRATMSWAQFDAEMARIFPG